MPIPIPIPTRSPKAADRTDRHGSPGRPGMLPMGRPARTRERRRVARILDRPPHGTERRRPRRPFPKPSNGDEDIASPKPCPLRGDALQSLGASAFLRENTPSSRGNGTGKFSRRGAGALRFQPGIGSSFIRRWRHYSSTAPCNQHLSLVTTTILTREKPFFMIRNGTNEDGFGVSSGPDP